MQNMRSGKLSERFLDLWRCVLERKLWLTNLVKLEFFGTSQSLLYEFTVVFAADTLYW